MNSPLSLGIDIGGTFTDLVIHDPRDGRAVIWKESTTPDDPARGALEGTRRVLEKAGAKPEQVGRVVHATTLFTNALIERKGAKTGLLTTAGFRDVLEIGRERKYELYDLFIEMPKPLVPRPWRREAMERLAADGSVEKPLDVDAALAEVAELVEQGVESLADLLPALLRQRLARACHRRGDRRALPEFVDLAVVRRVAGDPRVSAGVDDGGERLHPAAGRGLSRAARADVAGRGHSGRPVPDAVERRPHPCERGQAGAGAIARKRAGGGRAGRRLVRRNAGLGRGCWPSTWAARRPSSPSSTTASRWSPTASRRRARSVSCAARGLPMQIATVELIEIGAGGGSIAHRSELGTLNVGPESSGAQPGPACYGRGGTNATVTDADLTLGYLNADFFLGGAMKIDRAATDKAFGALASALQVEPGRAAFGVHDVVNENMAGAARVAIAERGRIPSEYALLATGGAGPVHAWHVARKLGVKRVVCPPGAGAGSTIGMLMAPARVDRVASFTRRSPAPT